MPAVLIGVDPGVTNCGVVVASVEETVPGTDATRGVSVVRCELFSLETAVGNFHSRVPACQCRLRHDNDLAMRVMHMIQEFDMSNARYVLIERQPPQSAGYTTEQLLRSGLTNIEYVHPNEIHRVYIRGLSAKPAYDERKALAEAYAYPFLKGFASYETSSRKHDMADALVAICAWVKRNRGRKAVPRPSPSLHIRPLEECDGFEGFIEQFSYVAGRSGPI